MARESIWSDLHHEIEHGTDGGVRLVTDVDSVKSSIDNILRTALGERVMHPEFGSGLRNLVFQPASQALMSKLISTITAALSKWDDRVSVESLNLYADPDQNAMRIELRCSVVGLGDVITQSLLF